MTQLKDLIELHELAKKGAARYPKTRFLFESLSQSQGRHFIGIVGPRGVGKTVLLKQMAQKREDSLYLSLDTFSEDLFETVKTLSERFRIDLFLLDEVHFLPGWDGVLKKIYDFLDVRVIFTSSVSLAMFDSAFDLSRRVRLLKLLPFTLREYLYFKEDELLAPLTLADIQRGAIDRPYLFASTHFKDYISGGLMPFALEEPDVLPLQENILKKIINKDIPAVARLRVDELGPIEKTVRFIGRAEVDGINYSSLSRNIGITNYKAESYVDLLSKAFVLQAVFPKGTNVMKQPKVLLSLPYRLLYKPYDEAVGGLREDFFAEMMRASGIEYHYLKTKRGAKTPDFLVTAGENEMVIEIGGKGKGRSQFKGIEANQKLIFSDRDIIEGIYRPLHLLGFLA
jgi:hypothetical protein